MGSKVLYIYTVIHLDKQNPEKNKDYEVSNYAESISV